MHSCTAKPVIRLAGCCFLLGLITSLGGCGTNVQHEVEHAEVSGKVLYEGKPVPGGQVGFVTVSGGFAASGNIDENGNYEIKSPVGEVIITVTNSMLQSGGGGKGGAKKGGGGKPKDLPHPGKQSGEAKAVEGHWVQIPSKYSDASSSDLRYTVKPGPQTHNIELTKAAPPGTSP
jgi:hypothetical protein